MTPIREWHYKLDRWCPAVLVGVIMIMVFPLRALVCLLLPPGANHPKHPLYKIKDFWIFEND